MHPCRRPATRGDRFIPDRTATNMDLAQGLLTLPTKKDNHSEIVSPSQEAYRNLLAETLLQGRTRILAFRSLPPPTPKNSLPEDPFSSRVRPPKKLRSIPKKEEDAFSMPDIISDDRINVVDWGSNGIIAVAIGNTVHLWNAETDTSSELVTVRDDLGPITSVSWSPDCRRMAIGLYNSRVLLYDPTTSILVRRLYGVQQGMVGSLAWNEYILSTGGVGGSIFNHDVRIGSRVVSTYDDHADAVCSLKWSLSGSHLASGGRDNLVHIWDVSKSTSLHRFENHKDTVRALAWCPFESGLLASGGGRADRSIKYWNVNANTCIKSVDTGSAVCNLLWNNNARELLSSHGFEKNQLTLWRYPTMVRMAELIGHKAPVLYLSQSPDECRVASAAGDETLKIWRIFEKSASKCSSRISHMDGPSNMYSYIR